MQLRAVRTMEIKPLTIEDLPPIGGVLFRHANADESTMYTRGTLGQRDIRQPGGGVASVPHIPYELGIDRAGNCCHVATSTNRDTSQVDALYEKVQRQLSKKHGWLMLDPTDKEQCEVTTDANGYQHLRVISRKILQEVCDRRNRARAKAMQEADKIKAETDRMIEVFKAATGQAPANTESAMRAAGAKPRRPAGDEA